MYDAYCGCQYRNLCFFVNQKMKTGVSQFRTKPRFDRNSREHIIHSTSGVLTTHSAGIIMSTTVTLDPDLPLRLLSSDH